MRHLMTVLALVSIAALSGCGSERPDPPAGDEPSTRPSATPSTSSTTSQAQVVDPSGTLVANGLLMQKEAGGPVELCMGGVAESYPPQCGGPRLVGEIDWDSVKPERASGVTWTSGSVWAVGRYDPKAGPSGTFTLERPVSLTPPTPDLRASEAPMTFPQLCDDPYAGGGRKGAGSPSELNELTELLPTLEGYVGSWVSDGSSLFNVVVTGDPEVALAKVRKVWPGGLCVEQRDVATEEDVRAAQDALATRFKGLLSTGGDTMNGTLDVHVTLLDQATHDRILDTVKPWLTPDQVRMTSAFQPLTQ